MGFSLLIPDEARSLPPPSLFNWPSLVLGFQGWMAAILDNAMNRRPPLKAGVHWQILFTSGGIGIGYYLMKRTNYMSAKKEQELLDYVKKHPEDFKTQEKRTMAEVLEDFYPVN